MSIYPKKPITTKDFINKTIVIIKQAIMSSSIKAWTSIIMVIEIAFTANRIYIIIK